MRPYSLFLVSVVEYREGGGGMNRETGMDIYTVLCIKEITNESLLYSTGGEVQSVGHVLN